MCSASVRSSAPPSVKVRALVMHTEFDGAGHARAEAMIGTFDGAYATGGIINAKRHEPSQSAPGGSNDDLDGFDNRTSPGGAVLPEGAADARADDTEGQGAEFPSVNEPGGSNDV